MTTGRNIGARILIVDDQAANIKLLSRILEAAGYQELVSTIDPRRIEELYQRHVIDLILLDLQMPHMDGLEALDLLRRLTPPHVYLPVLMLTGNAAPEARREALARGAKDFLNKPFDTTEVLLRIDNLLHTRALHVALERENVELEQRVEERTRQLALAQSDAVERLARAAEVRDGQTGLHTQRVGRIAARLAAARGAAPDVVRLIERAAPLHDVGKIAIPDHILFKPGSLSEDEMAVMRTHTTIGAQLLAGGASDLMRSAEQIALMHHERWDGSGYPNGLTGSAIPFDARLVALADFFDAVTSDRPYRAAWPLARALEEIGAQRGLHFDPALVDVFCSLSWEDHTR